jgi:hypothetical protein
LLKSFEELVFYACETLRFLTAKSSVKTIKVALKVNFFPSFLELLGQALYHEIICQILCNNVDACAGSSILLDKRVCPHHSYIIHYSAGELRIGSHVPVHGTLRIGWS